MPKNGNVIEISSYGGLRTNLLLYLLKKYNRNEKLFNYYPFTYEGYEDYKCTVDENVDGRNDITRLEYMEHIKQSYVSSNKFLSKGNLPHTFELRSDHFFQKYITKESLIDLFGNEVTLGSPISFTYIDHSYAAAKKEFDNISKFLLIGGFVLFDDSQDGLNMGSSLLMKEMNINFNLVDKNPNYLFQKIL
jgi:hypothetical protein